VSVYVDKMGSCLRSKKWPHNESCHLVADTVEELHSFAKRIGLKRKWFQNKLRLPHYDLTQNKRRLAVRNSAVEISNYRLVSMMKGNVINGQTR